MKRIAFTIILLLGLVEFGYGAWIPAKAWLSQILLQRAWDQSLHSGGSTYKPWSWADTWPIIRMAYNDNDWLVLSGDSGQALAFGPGHMGQSGMPGQGRNIIISGHRDTHFQFLKDIQIGDRIELTTVDGKSYWYRILSREIMNSKTQQLMETDSEILTLVTCYPFNSVIVGGPLRYVVQAIPDEGQIATGIKLES